MTNFLLLLAICKRFKIQWPDWTHFVDLLKKIKLNKLTFFITFISLSHYQSFWVILRHSESFLQCFHAQGRNPDNKVLFIGKTWLSCFFLERESTANHVFLKRMMPKKIPNAHQGYPCGENSTLFCGSQLRHSREPEWNEKDGKENERS